MRRFPIVPIVLCTVSLAAFAAAAEAAPVHWAHLRSVTVTVSNGSLPPPYGRPRTKRFATTRQLRRVTAALNANGIARRAPVPENGCVGATEVRIAISKAQGKRIVLSGNTCDVGDVTGNLAGFIAAVGL